MGRPPYGGPDRRGRACDDVRRAGRRRTAARPTRTPRWSCCCTAAAPTSSRSRRWPSTCPQDLAYAAVRAPIAEGGGYAWFANRGIGRPVAESLAETMAWFRELARRRGGGAAGGSSSGSAAARPSPADCCSPTRPGGPGSRSCSARCRSTPASRWSAGRLEGVPVLVAQGEQDRVIPRDLLDRTWAYLHEESGAALTAHLDPGGHGL